MAPTGNRIKRSPKSGSYCGRLGKQSVWSLMKCLPTCAVGFVVPNFLLFFYFSRCLNKGRYRSNWLRSQLKLLCATSVTYRFHTENPEISDASIQNVVARRIGACVLCTPDTIGGYKISYSLKLFVVFLSFCRKMP